jgi:hypothetical protein
VPVVPVCLRLGCTRCELYSGLSWIDDYQQILPYKRMMSPFMEIYVKRDIGIVMIGFGCFKIIFKFYYN